MGDTGRRRSRAARVAEGALAYRSDMGAVSALARLGALIDTFGNNRVAELLRVSASQPSRWRDGVERMSSANERKVLDLDYVMARLLAILPLSQIDNWLNGDNPFLGGRPIDFLRYRGPLAILPAVGAEEQGAYF